MYEIKVYFLSLLSDLTGVDEIHLSLEEDSTIQNVLGILIEKFGAEFEKKIFRSPEILNDYILIGLNGKDIRSINNMKTPINRGDEITFLPAIAGG